MQASLIIRLRDEGLLSPKDAQSELEAIMRNESRLNQDQSKYVSVLLNLPFALPSSPLPFPSLLQMESF
jgi:hypothetical protein